MGCNMCVVRHPEEQYRIMFQKGGSRRPVDRHVKGRGRRPSQLLDRPQTPQEASLRTRTHRRRGTFGVSSSSFYSVAMVTAPDCVDSGTQTDITFQNGMKGRPHGPAPSPPPPHLRADLYLFEDVDVSNQEEHQDQLEYEEVALSKGSQQQKLGLTVCYRTDDEDQLGLYVGEVNPDSIAAKNGRIREGDRIIQINGVDIQNREEAVAILTREDSVNFSLLLARPDVESETVEKDVGTCVDGGASNCSLPPPPLSGYSRLCPGGEARQVDMEEDEEEEEEGERGGAEDGPVPLPPLLSLAPLLSTSQDLDSGVGRTDDSTRYEDWSEQDLLGEQTSAPSTNTTNTPGSTRKFRVGPSPRPSPRPSPGPGPSPGRGDAAPPFFNQRESQPSTEPTPGVDWMSGGGGAYSPHHAPHPLQLHLHPHQPLMMMMPGLTEDEFLRYEELLDIKCQYDRHLQQRESAVVHWDDLGAGEEGEEEGEGEQAGDVNCTVSEHEMALIEEELRHLEFKCRNILRAQKMQQLRERCLKAWMMEETAVVAAAGLGDVDEDQDQDQDDPHHHELSAINELPERSDDRDTSSAYNTGGESCRSTPLVGVDPAPPEEEWAPSPPPLHPLGSLPLTPRRRWQDRDRCHSSLSCNFSPGPHRKQEAADGGGAEGSSSTPSTPLKFRSLSREAGSSSRRGVADGCRAGAAIHGPGGVSAESSPYFSRRQHDQLRAPERYQSCMTLPSDGLVEPLGCAGDRVRADADERGVAKGSSGPASPRSISSAPCGLQDQQNSLSRLGLALPLGMMHSSPTASPQRMEWKVKIRSDGTRYVTKRPVRDRLLKARAMKIKEERSGMTTDDDAASEMKQGRYWSKEERKQQLLRAREHRRRRELMMQSRLDYLRGDRDSGGGDSPQIPPSSNILSLSQRRTTKKRNRRILDNWMTIQELLAHGSRSPDGKKVYNPLLSVTTV